MPNRAKPGERHGVAIAALVLIAISLLSGPRPAAAAEPEPPFCETTRLHDYLTPLVGMPKLRELPFRRISEPLFRGVRIGAAGPALAVNGGRAGYQLQWDANPNWEVTLTFSRVSRNGKVVGPIRQRRLRLGELAPALITEPAFTMSGKPALYRTTLEIRSSTGHKLATFGNYFRVIRPAVNDRLLPRDGTLHPGDTLFARIENPGRAFILFGDEFEVEVPQGESWAPAPELPGPFVTPLSFIAPGTTANHCLILPLPASTPPGRYRLSQETVISWPFERHEQRPILHAEFEIAP